MQFSLLQSGLFATLIPCTYAAAVAHRADSDAPPPAISLSGAILTSKWLEGSDQVQILELLVTNTDTTNPLLKEHSLTVSVSSDDVEVVSNATVKRLFPGQVQVVQVGVKNKDGVEPGNACSVSVVAEWGSSSSTSTTASGPCGFGDYSASTDSLGNHWSPQWYNDAKYGIFIHWGVYAVPAYGNVAPNEDYAEWYWRRQHDPDYKSQTYQYHLDTYGADVNYDDFIANFTGSNFDANEWMSLIQDAGARYFVPVTKHHDGFAIFDVPGETSMRSSVNYGPKRDFLKELFAVAKASYPDIHRGTYFSMPEWYHPQYAQYSAEVGDNFPGGPPTNPYTGDEIPYTGYVEIDDFVVDLQAPQMRSLAYDYETEMIWCDIGGANNSTEVISEWLNWARGQGRQVTYNNRCGISSSDFDTPEYATNEDVVIKKWESNRGMDTFSFGYNFQTPDSSYLTGADIVHSLVDIVSKNGNFLLDIGPKADGSVPEIMQTGLRDAGVWISAHAESIFDTRFWYETPGKDPFRYTTTVDAFYIHVISQPNSTVSITDPIPYLAGDKVTVVGGDKAGEEVPASSSDGTVVLTLSDEIIAADRYVWTFKIEY